MVMLRVRPSIPHVESSPSSPKQWSPCRCEMKIWSSRLVRSPICRMVICAPSPTSTRNCLSHISTTCELGVLVRVGLAEPQPRMVILFIVVSWCVVVSVLWLVCWCLEVELCLCRVAARIVVFSRVLSLGWVLSGRLGRCLVAVGRSGGGCAFCLGGDVGSCEDTFGVFGEVALHEPSVVSDVGGEHLVESLSLVFAESEYLVAVGVVADASCEVGVAVVCGVFCELFDGVGQVRVSFDLCAQHFVGSLCVGVGGVCVEEVFVAVEAVCGGESVRLFLLEDGVSVDEAASSEVEVDAGSQQFFCKQWYVEGVGVISGEVAAFDDADEFACYVFEPWAVAYVVVGDAMHGAAFGRYGYLGVDPVGLALSCSVREDLEV